MFALDAVEFLAFDPGELVVNQETCLNVAREIGDLGLAAPGGFGQAKVHDRDAGRLGAPQ